MTGDAVMTRGEDGEDERVVVRMAACVRSPLPRAIDCTAEAVMVERVVVLAALAVMGKSARSGDDTAPLMVIEQQCARAWFSLLLADGLVMMRASRRGQLVRWWSANSRGVMVVVVPTVDDGRRGDDEGEDGEDESGGGPYGGGVPSPLPA
ncbi:hypothetical protein Dimus_011595 [Dionaea muscipula]